jgi:DMSO/TMAO reductase YedYZ molybdopterin-dependent catalytic subunit
MVPIVMAATLFLASPILLSCHDTGYLDVDPATGLHITGDVTEIDITSYRLSVTGKVEREISLTYDEILELSPRVTASPDLVCPGYFVDKATWSGVPFKSVLDMAGLQPDAAWVRMKSADVYTIKVPLGVALSPDSFLAYELGGQTLPAEHGFPLRAVFPGEDGNRWVKWIVELVVE